MDTSRDLPVIKTCILCGEQFTQDEIEEWRESGEAFSSTPQFICPDCLDREPRFWRHREFCFHQDLEEQFRELMEEY